MGAERTISFTGSVPSWQAIGSQLRRLGIEPVLRMIDGLPAFPDEQPEDSWKELRAGFAPGMVTIRRGVASLACVVWGNADDSLRAAWNALSWACAAAGDVGCRGLGWSR